MASVMVLKSLILLWKRKNPNWAKAKKASMNRMPKASRSLEARVRVLVN